MLFGGCFEPIPHRVLGNGGRCLDLSLLDGAVDLEGCILRQAVMGGGSATQVLFCMQLTDISHGNSDLKVYTFGFANE